MAGGGGSGEQLAASVNPEDGSLAADVSAKVLSVGDGAGGGASVSKADGEMGVVEAAARAEVGDLMQGWLSSSVSSCGTRLLRNVGVR